MLITLFSKLLKPSNFEDFSTLGFIGWVSKLMSEILDYIENFLSL